MRAKTFLLWVSLITLFVGLILTATGQRSAANINSFRGQDDLQPSGGGVIPQLPGDRLSAEQNQRMEQQINTSIERLVREGKIKPAAVAPRAAPESAGLFHWPIRPVPGFSNFNIDAISNFVDHNPLFPNQITDYNCGSRSYDLPDGSNHQGIDIVSWPFWWNKMDRQEADVVAVADGVLVFKQDHLTDRNCGLSGGDWNVVAVRHPDGSLGIYGHLKQFSATTKAVGSQVFRGEHLGFVGSSGQSTGPHLHLEVRVNGQSTVHDPYAGPCNTKNSFSYWAEQPAYRISRINKLMTHSAPPVFPTCPNPEIENAKNEFDAGEQVIVASYYRDQLTGQQSQLSLVRPDGSVHETWTHTAPDTGAATYWFWTRTLPADAVSGAWKFRAVYNGETYEHTFQVNGVSPPARTPFDFDGDGRTDVSVYRPSDGTWYLNRSTLGFQAVQFGAAADRLTPGDFDGDGITDIAVWRPEGGTWYRLNSSNGSFVAVPFGQSGDQPLAADFDGDGRDDITIWRPSEGIWYRLNSSNSQFVAVPFGQTGDVPVPADYDGDGSADIAVWRPADGTWYRLNSGNGQFHAVTFGLSPDLPVPADFDGDRRADISVFRPASGDWYRLNSGNGQFVALHFGANGDQPVAGDYDGDGRTDQAVFRGGNWYVNGSTSGFAAVGFGVSTDRPVPNAYIR